MYKKITEVISAEVSEARNTPAKSATILLSGIQDFSIGDNVVLAQARGSQLRYFSLSVKEVTYKNGNTELVCEDLLQQIFDLLLPEVEDQSGEASAIIKTILQSANTLGFIDIYVDDQNIDDSGVSYTKVNASKRKIGELFQDICTDTGFVMWVGYDEAHNQPNAFFFKNETDFEVTTCSLREGYNIISEDLNKGSKDDIINYILFYYYPTRYPFAEDWTEGGIGRKLWNADVKAQLKAWYHTREVRVRNSGAYCYPTANMHNGDTSITVNSTTGFTSTGYLDVGGSMVLHYTSKDATHFYLANPLDLLSDIIATDTYFIYERRENLTDESLAEYASESFPFFKDFPITKIGIYVDSKVGSPGPLVIRFYDPSTGKFEKKYTITNPLPGWNYIDVDLSIIYEWVSCTIFISIDEINTNDDYYTLGMGHCLSATEQLNDGEYWYWQAYGAPSDFGEDDLQGFSDPTQMLSLYCESDYSEETPLWEGTALIGDDCKYIPWSAVPGIYRNFRKEGTDALRIIGPGNAVLTLSPGLVITDFDRIHLWRYGTISKITLNCDTGGSYYKSFSAANDWVEETLKFTDMTQVGNVSQVITSIKIDCNAGNGFIDSLYFLYPASGLAVVVKDDTSIAKYHQKPQVVYGRGITSSSYALSLAQKILDNNKEPKWKGTITTQDRVEMSSRNSIMVIIPSKGISEVMGIYQVTHHSDGLAELEVGEFVFDYAKILARLNSQIQNLEITVGSPSEGTQENLSLYALHAFKHQSGGEDEINVQGLQGELDNVQKSSWGKLADIPPQVSNLPLSVYGATSAPTINDDITQGYAVGSRWLDVTNDDEYVCLDATAGAAVWKKTTP